MTAKYWTTNGSDIYSFLKREVFEFKNLETGEVVTCDCVTEVKENNFVPITMPEIKKQKEKVKSLRSGKKSQYKGVTPVGTKGKFRACFWDQGKNKHLGTFDSELLAAAAYQEHIGDQQEAKRLLNEYQEGDERSTMDGAKTGKKTN